jgi:hypothetical protein
VLRSVLFLVVFSHQTKYRKMNSERIEKALPSQQQYRDDDDITSRTSVGNGHREMLPGEVDVE